MGSSLFTQNDKPSVITTFRESGWMAPTVTGQGFILTAPLEGRRADTSRLTTTCFTTWPGTAIRVTPSSVIYLDMDGVYNCTITNNIIYNIKHKYCVHARGPNHVIRNNVIDLAGPDLLEAIHILAGYKLANVAVDEPPLHNFNYTYENNIVCSSSGAIFRVRHVLEEDTFKRLDNNVYYNPDGQCFCTYEGGGPDGKYFRRQVTMDEWRQMGLDAHTKFTDPLFVDRENHNYHLKPGSPALMLGFKNIDTSRIGLKKDFPYDDSGRLRMEHGQN